MITNLTSFKNIQTGDLPYLKALLAQIEGFNFQIGINKTITASKGKMECLAVALKFHAYVRCMACDPFAGAKNLYKLNDSTFSIYVDKDFGDKLNIACRPFI